MNREKAPRKCTLINELSELQKAVSIGADEVGLIEIVTISPNALLLCNEEGKLIGLKPNRRIGNDIICGVFYIISQDSEGNLASLPEEAMRFYTSYFAVPDVIDPDEVEATISFRFEEI